MNLPDPPLEAMGSIVGDAFTGTPLTRFLQRFSAVRFQFDYGGSKAEKVTNWLKECNAQNQLEEAIVLA